MGVPFIAGQGQEEKAKIKKEMWHREINI